MTDEAPVSCMFAKIKYKRIVERRNPKAFD
jgi:hypothetical protein